MRDGHLRRVPTSDQARLHDVRTARWFGVSSKTFVPLRWAGSKRSLLPVLREQVPRAAGCYYEPFAGSACLFFNQKPGRAVLGDLNAPLVATYRTIRHRPDAVGRCLNMWQPEAETYYAVRGMRPGNLDAVTRAARFVFLNRLCFNGVYRTNRAGQFNVPFGSRSGPLPTSDQLRGAARQLRAAELRCGQFDETTADAGHGDVVYLDPPYTQRPDAAYGVYGYGSFSAVDLGRLIAHAHRLDDAGAAVVVSYADVAAIGEGFGSGWEIRSVCARGQVAGRIAARRTRDEVLVLNARAVQAGRPA